MPRIKRIRPDLPIIVMSAQNNILTAYLAINTGSRDFPKLQRLIRRRVPLAGKEEALQDPAVDLKSLI